MRETRDVLPTPSPPMYKILKGDDDDDDDDDDDAPENSLMVDSTATPRTWEVRRGEKEARKQCMMKS